MQILSGDSLQASIRAEAYINLQPLVLSQGNLCKTVSNTGNTFTLGRGSIAFLY